MDAMIKRDRLIQALLDASRFLDPTQKGIHWPNPIEWDGRPLDEQAGDILALLYAWESEEGLKIAAALEQAVEELKRESPELLKCYV